MSEDEVMQGYMKVAREQRAYTVSAPSPERISEEIAERVRINRECRERAAPFFEELTALCEKHNVRLSAAGDERGCCIYLQDNDTWRYIADVEDGEFPGDWRVS